MISTKNDLTLTEMMYAPSGKGSYVLPSTYEVSFKGGLFPNYSALGYPSGSILGEESGLVIRRSNKDERAVCGKRPDYIGICVCTKSDCNCNIGKKCCNEKKQVVANQAKWQKCIDEVRAYNIQVNKDNMALPPESSGGGSGGSGSGSGSGLESEGSGGGSGTGAGSGSAGSGAGAGAGGGAALVGKEVAAGTPAAPKSKMMMWLIIGAVLLILVVVGAVMMSGKKATT